MAERITAPWAFQEMVEDAIVAYLHGIVSGTANVRPALDASEYTEPAVVVYAQTDDNGDTEMSTGFRAFAGTIHVRTPAVVETLDGAEIASARQRHAALASDVIAALNPQYESSQPYLVLAEAVNAAGVPGVTIAEMTMGARTRDPDDANNCIVSVIEFSGQGYPTGVAG